MAKSDNIPGIEVEIVIDGQVAEEWDPPHDVEVGEPPGRLDTDDDKPHAYVVKYIEAKQGAPFLFRVSKKYPFRRRGHHMAYAAQVDGEFMEHDHEHNQEGKKGKITSRPWTGITKGYYSGTWDPEPDLVEHLFTFKGVRIGRLCIPPPLASTRP